METTFRGEIFFSLDRINFAIFTQQQFQTWIWIVWKGMKMERDFSLKCFYHECNEKRVCVLLRVFFPLAEPIKRYIIHFSETFIHFIDCCFH